MTDKLLCLVERFSGRLPEIDIETVRDYICHNEEEVAIYHLLHAICEVDLGISNRDFTEINFFLESGCTKFKMSDNLKGYLLNLIED